MIPGTQQQILDVKLKNTNSKNTVCYSSTRTSFTAMLSLPVEINGVKYGSKLAVYRQL